MISIAVNKPKPYQSLTLSVIEKEKKEYAISQYKKDLMYPCSGCYINHAPHSRRRHLWSINKALEASDIPALMYSQHKLVSTYCQKHRFYNVKGYIRFIAFRLHSYGIITEGFLYDGILFLLLHLCTVFRHISIYK